MDVQIDVSYDNNDMSSWELEFNICSVEPAFTFRYYIGEPCMNSIDQWKKLAKGENAPGAMLINIDENGYYNFDMWEEGYSEGGIASYMKIKKEYIMLPLSNAIDKAINLGCKFSD